MLPHHHHTFLKKDTYPWQITLCRRREIYFVWAVSKWASWLNSSALWLEEALRFLSDCSIFWRKLPPSSLLYLDIPLLRHLGRGNKQNTSGTPQLPLLIYHQIEMEDVYLKCFEAQQPIFALMLGLTQIQASAHCDCMHYPQTVSCSGYFFLPYIGCKPDPKTRPYSNTSFLSPPQWLWTQQSKVWLQLTSLHPRASLQICLLPHVLLPELKCWLYFYSLAVGKWKVWILPMHGLCLFLIPYQAPNSGKHMLFCSSPIITFRKRSPRALATLWQFSQSKDRGRALDQGNIYLEGQLKVSHSENFGFLWSS